MAYHLIGDVHGHHDKLVALLEHLGYRVKDGAWRHPTCTAVFVGDLIDRGEKNVATVSLVRNMVEAGSAHAVMGNHELNAIAWLLRDPRDPSKHLRERTDKHRKHHVAFLHEVGEDSELHHELVEWFLTLPLWFDLDGIRVAHACGHPRFVDYLKTRLPDARLTRELMPAAITKPADRAEIDTPELTLFKAVDAVLKGVEWPMPAGLAHADKDGTARSRARVKWWDAEATTLDKAALIDGGPAGLEAVAVPEHVRPGAPENPVCFFGHYWFKGRPAPVAPTAACVDYSAGKGGDLVAYRWDGEPELDAAHFTWAGRE